MSDDVRKPTPPPPCSWCGEPSTRQQLNIGAARAVDVCDQHYRTIERERVRLEAEREERQRKRRERKK